MDLVACVLLIEHRSERAEIYELLYCYLVASLMYLLLRKLGEDLLYIVNGMQLFILLLLMAERRS